MSVLQNLVYTNWKKLEPNDRYYSDFFFEYHRIGVTAYREKVYFFERNQKYLEHLDTLEVIELKVDYSLCLFEIGKYNRFLDLVDDLIETVILENIYTYNSIDIYSELLFKKAAALYNLGFFEKSLKILKAVSNIRKDDMMARTLYGRCIRLTGLRWYQNIKTVSVVFLLLALIFSIFDLFVIDTFFEEYSSFMMYSKLIFFILSLFLLLYAEISIKIKIAKETNFSFNKNSFLDFLSL